MLTIVIKTDTEVKTKSGKTESSVSSPDAALRALDGLCLKSEAAEYTYELCLFRSATQHEHRSRGSTVRLGQAWKWLTAQPDGSDATFTGVLTGGDRCVAAGVSRSIHVRFLCAADGDFLGKVSERSTCAYEVEMRTPAACT